MKKENLNCNHLRQSFGKLLNDTVGGEKLSASKVDRVRDSAVGQFHVR